MIMVKTTKIWAFKTTEIFFLLRRDFNQYFLNKIYKLNLCISSKFKKYIYSFDEMIVAYEAQALEVLYFFIWNLKISKWDP